MSATENGINMTSEQIDKVTESRLLKEIKDSVQTFNHQVVSMSSGNGLPVAWPVIKQAFLS